MPATALSKADTDASGMAAWPRAECDLPDLPYKVESNARGQLILPPSSPAHGFSQFGVGASIDAPGRAATEFSVQTADGVEIPDVIWTSDERRAETPESVAASPVMPDLCVEVVSDANTEAEMADRRALYFEDEAKEVWAISQANGVRFFGAGWEVEQSARAPGFPKTIQS